MDILDALVKILVPAIERLAGAVETIQSSYADMLAKMDNVAAAVNGTPHAIYWIGAIGAFLAATATFFTLLHINRRTKEQNTIRLKDKMLEEMKNVLGNNIKLMNMTAKAQLRQKEFNSKECDLLIDAIKDIIMKFSTYIFLTSNLPIMTRFYTRWALNFQEFEGEVGAIRFFVPMFVSLVIPTKSYSDKADESKYAEEDSLSMFALLLHFDISVLADGTIDDFERRLKREKEYFKNMTTADMNNLNYLAEAMDNLCTPQSYKPLKKDYPIHCQRKWF